jgi:putative methionine-R-sulfoxide reductase with GAF domain
MRVASRMPVEAPPPRRSVRRDSKDAKCRALQTIGSMIIAGARGPAVLTQIAEFIQRECKYRWIGVYKIRRHEFVIEAATNKMKPAAPRFPITQGLSAEAVETRTTVLVPDVSKDGRFIPNFWTTKSEIIVPIIDDEHDRVVGTIVAESAELNAFNKKDRDFLEGVAGLIWRVLV